MEMQRWRFGGMEIWRCANMQIKNNNDNNKQNIKKLKK